MLNKDVYNIHSDHLGTPRAVTNAKNEKLWQWEGDAFGDSKPQIETIKQPLRFAGQYSDDEVGLFYNYFRFYNPETGRYVENDPIDLQGGLNRYGYVSANPLHNIDPFGRVGLTMGSTISTAISVCTGTVGTACAVGAVSAVGIGAYWVTDTYVNPWLQPIISKAVDTCTTDWDSFEKQMDYENYHRTCDRPPPPELLEKGRECELARWKRRQAQSCYDKRKEWEDKWGDSTTKEKHDKGLANVKQRISNAVEDIIKYCPA